MAAQCWQCIFAVKCGFGVTLFNTVASLGLMSPGVVTDGVTLFFLRKLTTSLVIVLKGDDLFLFIITTFSHCLPNEPFPSTLCKIQPSFSYFHQAVCHPLDGVIRGGPPPPPSNATALTHFFSVISENITI